MITLLCFISITWFAFRFAYTLPILFLYFAYTPSQEPLSEAARQQGEEADEAHNHGEEANVGTDGKRLLDLLCANDHRIRHAKLRQENSL